MTEIQIDADAPRSDIAGPPTGFHLAHIPAGFLLSHQGTAPLKNRRQEGFHLALQPQINALFPLCFIKAGRTGQQELRVFQFHGSHVMFQQGIRRFFPTKLAHHFRICQHQKFIGFSPDIHFFPGNILTNRFRRHLLLFLLLPPDPLPVPGNKLFHFRQRRTIGRRYKHLRLLRL